ncbi:hypothetical protein Tco_0606033 [Tanacetum coccineum]
MGLQNASSDQCISIPNISQAYHFSTVLAVLSSTLAVLTKLGSINSSLGTTAVIVAVVVVLVGGVVGGVVMFGGGVVSGVVVFGRGGGRWYGGVRWRWWSAVEVVEVVMVADDEVAAVGFSGGGERQSVMVME